MPIETLDPKNSVLFLGSGFSAGAISISKRELPAGNALLKLLAAELDEDPAELDLKSAADEFISRSDLNLYNLLYETFTASKLLAYQSEILALPWARIYTTNYDDILSLAKGSNFPSYTFDDPRPRKLPNSFGVYLHGSIRRANEENADQQLILNNKSYDIIARQYPTWFNEFQRDRQRFDACYFIGFSLSDHHIAGLMTAGEESKKRTYFVSRKDPKPMFVRRASDYGEVVPIGLEAFPSLAKTLPMPEKPQSIAGLQSFKLLRPGMDSKALTAPTPVEIINLVTLGSFNQSRYFNTPPALSYVADREEPVSATIELLKQNKTILAHSRLGNGKSIFVSVLASEATGKGYKCLVWRRAGQRLSQDLEVLAEQTRVLIIFDDYDAAIENIERVSRGVPDAKFVVTVRTSQQEVRLHEIIESLPSPVKRVNINPFSASDKRQLLAILDRAGARVDRLEETIQSAQEVRDIVTQLYNHTDIREKISISMRDVPAQVSQILIMTCLIKYAGVKVEDSYLQSIAGRDVYTDLRGAGSFVGDLLDLRDDAVEMRSSLLSEFMVQRIFSVRSILDGCYTIATSSIRRRANRVHRRLSGELMKYSTLQRLLRFNSNLDEELEAHYERLSNDKDINAEPLFWLQYAILMKTSGNIANARLFLNTGYERARRIDGYKTFQLDTQALSIYMLEERASNDEAVGNLTVIVDAIRIISNMIGDQSDRQYAIEVIGEIPAFIEVRHSVLKDPEKIALIFELNRAIRNLAALPLEEQTYSGSELVRAELEKAVAVLAAPTKRNS